MLEDAWWTPALRAGGAAARPDAGDGGGGGMTTKVDTSAERVRLSRAKQGLPPKIESPTVLAQIAALVQSATNGTTNIERRPS